MNILYAVIAAFFVLFPFQSISAQVCITLDNNLYVGARDASVLELQKFLQSTGDYTDTQLSGYFGLSTQQAVQRFQVRHSIVSSGAANTTGYGAVGPQTRAVINSYCTVNKEVTTSSVSTSSAAPSSSASAPASSSITRTLSVGSSGGDVRALQEFLKKEGDYTYGEVTGYFGPVTQEAVQRFQARTGVVSSGSPQTTGYGLVGPSTRRALAQEMSGSSSVSVTSQNVSPIVTQPSTITPRIVTPVTPTITPTPTTPVPTITPSSNPVPSVSPLSQQEYVPGVQVSANPALIGRGETSQISWTSNYAVSCKRNFGEKEGGSATSGSITVSPLWLTTYFVECTSASGHYASNTVEVKIKQRLSDAQIRAIGDLLRGWNVAEGAVTDVEAVLKGLPPALTTNTRISDQHLEAITSLLGSFGTDKITISLVQEILTRGSGGIDPIPERPPTVSLSVSANQAAVDESITFSWKSTDALVCSQPIKTDDKGNVNWELHLGRTEGATQGSVGVVPFPASEWSNFNGSAKNLYMVGCRGLFYPDEVVTASAKIEFKKPQPEVFLQEIIGSSVRELSFVKDPSRGNLLYFTGSQLINGVQKQGVFVAANCPNHTGSCRDISLVLDKEKIGFIDIDDVSVVQMTDSTNTGRGYYLMYLSGIEKEKTDLTARGFFNTYYSTSWVGDGMNWSQPQLLLPEHHSPSAIRAHGDRGEVILFTNSAVEEAVFRHQLGVSGVVPANTTKMSLPMPDGGGYHRNVDVQFACEKVCYYLLRAIRYGSSQGHSFIDSYIQNVGDSSWKTYVPSWRPSHENASLHAIHVPWVLNTGLAYRNTHRYFIGDGGKIFARVENPPTGFIDSIMKSFADAFSRGINALANTLSIFF